MSGHRVPARRVTGDAQRHDGPFQLVRADVAGNKGTAGLQSGGCPSRVLRALFSLMRPQVLAEIRHGLFQTPMNIGLVKLDLSPLKPELHLGNTNATDKSHDEHEDNVKHSRLARAKPLLTCDLWCRQHRIKHLEDRSHTAYECGGAMSPVRANEPAPKHRSS